MEETKVENLSLGEAASRFLAKLPARERAVSQAEVNNFVRWYGRERALAGLGAHEIENYAERLSQSDTDHVKRLEVARQFLTFAKKEGWSRSNLSVHLKVKKGKATAPVASRSCTETIPLTRQGHTEMTAELETLKQRRPQLIEEIRRAAADKDFRENAPLHAAREQRSHLEGRIKELEGTLKSAVIIDEERKPSLQANLGDTVVLCDLATNEELRYQLVTPKEMDPAQGRISNASPIGKAVVGRGEGETVEVTVPAGKLRYQVKRIEH